MFVKEKLSIMKRTIQDWKIFSNNSAQENENPLKAVMSIHYTFWAAVIIGFTGIIGYALNLDDFRCKMLYLLLLLALASFISGFFLGFLFGIPKRTDDKDAAYHLSNNLTDISDWLTKIIIGLGLVEIKAIPGALYSLGIYIQSATHADDSIKVFSVCCLIYFSIFGLYFGYNYMRLFLSNQYKDADDKLLMQKKLTEKAHILEKVITDPIHIDESTKLKLADYNQFLKNSKSEKEYTFDDWYYKGLNAFENSLYNPAIRYFETALALDDKSGKAPDAYLNMGASYLNLSNFDHSLKINKKLLSDYPGYDKTHLVHNNIGVALMKQGNRKEALEYYNKAIKLKPENAFAYYNKACNYALMDEKDLMLENLKIAIRLDNSFKSTAKTDTDLSNFSKTKEFTALLDADSKEVK
jgi:tetratricopeptide (TPR) repeat protein